MIRNRLFCAAAYAAILALAACLVSAEAAAASYTRIAPVQAKVVGAAPEFPGGGYRAENLLKPAAPGGFRSEYASHGQGQRTFVDFDLGKPVPVAAFRHIQRRTIDTMAEANLVFSGSADLKNPVATVKVKHVDEPGATTFAAFPPVTARFVR